MCSDSWVQHHENILEMTSLLWQKWWLMICFELTLNLLPLGIRSFNDSFNTRDHGYITLTPLLSAVRLPRLKHLAHGSASIHFAPPASIPVLVALTCHCWLHLSVRRSEHPALTWLHSQLPHVFIHWHHVHLLPGFSLIPSGPDGSCWKKIHCITVRGKWRLITILTYFDNPWSWSYEHVIKC